MPACRLIQSVSTALPIESKRERELANELQPEFVFVAKQQIKETQNPTRDVEEATTVSNREQQGRCRRRRRRRRMMKQYFVADHVVVVVWSLSIRVGISSAR